MFAEIACVLPYHLSLVVGSAYIGLVCTFNITRGKVEGGRRRRRWCQVGVCGYCAFLLVCLNQFIALIYFATSLAISSIPNNISIAIGL